MTREQADNWKAGPELDALVAERFMGWECPPKHNYWMTFGDEGTFDLHVSRRKWAPSTKPEHAAMVADELRNRGVSVDPAATPLEVCRMALCAPLPV